MHILAHEFDSFAKQGSQVLQNPLNRAHQQSIHITRDHHRLTSKHNDNQLQTIARTSLIGTDFAVRAVLLTLVDRNAYSAS